MHKDISVPFDCPSLLSNMISDTCSTGRYNLKRKSSIVLQDHLCSPNVIYVQGKRDFPYVLMKKFLIIFVILLFNTRGFAQQKYVLTVEQTAALAQTQSIDAMVAKNIFLGNYWGFRSFKASLLPSINLSANIAQFDRSQKALQNATTGEIAYRENYNMYNTANLSIDQQLAATGGTLSIYSSLSRLDQFQLDAGTTYYTQPITLSYMQPLWSYNRLKWDKQIEPQKYERAKREYLEAMEDITIRATDLFFNLLLNKINYDIAVSNYTNTRTMYKIAEQRFAIGSVQKDELLQLELRLINDSLNINNKENQYITQKQELRSFLGFNDNVDIDLIMPDSVPMLTLDQAFVQEKAINNSSFMLSQVISQLEGERAIAQAKAERGITAQISTQFGLSNNSDQIRKAYSHLIDREVVGLTLSIPIMDWGMGRGRVLMAKAQMETINNQVEQAIIDYKQDLFNLVLQFNSQRNQVMLARKANDISEERYRISMANFANGSLSVTDLNTAQSEKDEANRQYIVELSNYWNYYYQIRKKSLYDFLSGTDISAEFDNLVK